MTFDSPLVSVDWLHDNLDLPHLVLLDASLAKPKSSSEESPLSRIQIPGSRFFDLNGHFSDLSSDLPHMMCDPEHFTKSAQNLGVNANSVIIVYDNLGVYSAPRAWWMFRSMGHENVVVLDGGLPEWTEKGFSTEEKTKKTVTKGNFQVKSQLDYFRDSACVLDAIDAPDKLIVDARSKGRFYGTESEPRKGLRGGHIPGSESLPFPEVMAGTRMKSKSELIELFSRFDISGKELVFSCGSGLTACIILLAAYVSGHEKLSVYDGSWSEWGLPSTLPVVTD